MSDSARQLVMYVRRNFCPYVGIARHVLDELGAPYREIDIDADTAARDRVVQWTGFLSVPTLVVAEAGEVVPYEPPAHLPRGHSPRGIDRGSMITEASDSELTRWLEKHDLIPHDTPEIKDALDRGAD
ncbi:MAG: glutaredoxin family protein [Chloroflexi bacterium]|nr:glutaredoxin family protein [Chloroflexota bacterium]